jgi:LysR family hydrogen peroxide-inducible transcriptional activator
MNFSAYAFSLRQLQYVVAVADLLSFHRAADECHVSQPSLSLQIAEIERVLAITIFERDPHRVALTAAGREFVESARVVLHAADALAETARRCIDPFSGTLRIGVIRQFRLIGYLSWHPPSQGLSTSDGDLVGR